MDGERVQALKDHLVDNAAGYPQRSEFIGIGWRGPYVERLTADPWGSRYAANVQFLQNGSGGITIVVSAGPDKRIDTPFRLETLTVRGDDLIALVANSP